MVKLSLSGFRGLKVWCAFLGMSAHGWKLRGWALWKASYVDYGCRFTCNGTFTMGRGVVIQRHAMIGIGKGAHLLIEDHTRIGSDVVISCGERIRIGRSVLIAARCFIGDYGHAFSDGARPVMEQGGGNQRPIDIGDGCWLGINVCILPGVKLGRNCVVAANSVVRESFPDQSIVAGAPARLIRTSAGA